MISKSKNTKSMLKKFVNNKYFTPVFKYEGDKKQKISPFTIYNSDNRFYYVKIDELKDVYFAKIETTTISEIVMSIIPVIVKERDKKEEKLEIQRKKKEEISNSINVGDIFYTSFGYSMTLVDFYQVTEKVSISTVKVRSIRGISDNDFQGQIRPSVNDFISEEKSVRINPYGLSNIDGYGNTGRKTTADASHYFNRLD